MSPTSIMIIEYTTMLFICGVIAKQYLWPRLRKLPLKAALPPLLLAHVARVIGLTSLVPGITHPSLSSGFTFAQAYGDLIAAILAAITLLAIFFRSRAVIPFAWIFSIVGSADFLFAAFNAIRYNVFADLGGYWIVPMMIVPPLAIIHILIIALLLRKPQQ